MTIEEQCRRSLGNKEVRMVVNKTVLKVDLSCYKCRKKLLKGITGLEGVDKIEIDAAKGTITIIGNADPYEIIVQARKAGRYAEVVTIGPPPPPPPEKKPDEKKSDQKDAKKDETKAADKKPEPVHKICHHPQYIYHMMPAEDPHYASCSIL